MWAVSLISTMKVDWPLARLSLAPTREKIWSTIPMVAEAAGTWFPRTPVELWSQYDTLHLMTTAGPIDIVFAPDGAPSGYAELVDDAMSAALDHQEVMVITVAQWEALKQASGRAKDLEHLDRFYASRSEE
jgi:hypothetical protein